MAGRPGALWSTFRKDRLTEEYLRSLGLNDRQVQAVLWVKRHGSITNRQYRELNGVSNKTAYLELADLIRRGVLRQEGTGKTRRYVLSQSTVTVTER
jgi:ATP-dependent DNA helicase RecG